MRQQRPYCPEGRVCISGILHPRLPAFIFPLRFRRFRPRWRVILKAPPVSDEWIASLLAPEFGQVFVEPLSGLCCYNSTPNEIGSPVFDLGSETIGLCWEVLALGSG